MANDPTSIDRTDRDRSPEEIEREIEQTRAEMNRTIDAIQRKLSPGQLMDQAFDYFRSGPGAFANNFGQALKNNPVPVALVGIGLAWLALGGSRTPSYLRASPQPSGNGGIGETAGHAMERMGDMASSAGDYASETASQARARASDMAQGASERVREMADNVRDLAAEWSEGASTMAGGARDMASSARQQAQQLGSTMQDRAARASEGASHLLHEQPLVVGALGLAIGAVLGAMLPPTRPEDEMMGEMRDRTVDQATSAGREAMQQATGVAQKAADAATDAAKQEADRRGLTPEALAGSFSPEAERSSGSQSDDAARQGQQK